MFSAVCKSKMIICAKGRAVSHFARTSYTVQSCSIRTRARKESPTLWAEPSALLKSAKNEIKWFKRLKSPIASNPASRNCDKHFTFDMQRILRTASTVFMGRFAPASSLVQSSPTPSLDRISYLAQGVREGKELSGYNQRCRQMTLFSTKLKAIFNLNAGPESAGVLLCFRCYSTGDEKPTAAQGKGTEASSTPGRGEGVTTFKELYENPWTIPNFLCMARIGLSPFLGYLIVEKEFHLSLGLFVLAGITDLLDGYIARNWANQKSALGSALDPLADKILISILYISLTYAHLIPVPLTAMIISRDVALIAAVFYVRYKTVPPPRTLSKFFNPCYATAQLKPTFISKVNTAVQLTLVAASLAAPVFQYVDSVFLQTLWFPARRSSAPDFRDRSLTSSKGSTTSVRERTPFTVTSFQVSARCILTPRGSSVAAEFFSCFQIPVAAAFKTKPSPPQRMALWWGISFLSRPQSTSLKSGPFAHYCRTNTSFLPSMYYTSPGSRLVN